MDARAKSDLPLAVALRALREGKELSLTEVAGQLDLSRGYLWRLEHGDQSNPSREVCAKLARFYELDPSVFLEEGDADHLAALSDDGWLRLGKQLTAKQRLHVGGLISDLAAANAPRNTESASTSEGARAPVKARAGATNRSGRGRARRTEDLG